MSSNGNAADIDWDDLIGRAQEMFNDVVKKLDYQYDYDKRAKSANAAANLINAIVNADRRREEVRGQGKALPKDMLPGLKKKS